MANMVIKNIQFKRGTKEALTNYLKGEKMLLAGEPAFESDTGQLKIGNGADDYIDLPYVGNGLSPSPTPGGGEDERFLIRDPKTNQVLLYDTSLKKWVNKDLADKESIIYLSNHGLSIKGYDEATQGQMLVKDNEKGLAWVNPVSEEHMQSYVADAQASVTAASNYATAAGNSAVEANNAAVTSKSINDATMQFVNNKFWWGTLEEYNKLTSISPGTFYFITATGE